MAAGGQGHGGAKRPEQAHRQVRETLGGRFWALAVAGDGSEDDSCSDLEEEVAAVRDPPLLGDFLPEGWMEVVSKKARRPAFALGGKGGRREGCGRSSLPALVRSALARSTRVAARPHSPVWLSPGKGAVGLELASAVGLASGSGWWDMADLMGLSYFA